MTATAVMISEEEEQLLYLCLKVQSDEFDRFIGACMDEHKQPKAPAYKELMQARGYLPPHCKNTLVRPK